ASFPSSRSAPAARSAVFPYTTLFRSLRKRNRAQAAGGQRRGGRGEEFPAGGGLHGAIIAGYNGPVDEQQIRALIDRMNRAWLEGDRKSTRLNSSHVKISYAVFCLKKK